MTKFHINPETGKPAPCTASARACKYGADAAHFDNAVTAQMAYEDTMSDVVLPAPARRISLPPLPKPDSARIAEVQVMTNAAYVFANKLRSDAKANRGARSENPTDLYDIAHEIDTIVENGDFSTVEGSERTLENLVEYKNELIRKADHFDAKGRKSMSRTYYNTSVQLADMITENGAEAA